MRYFPPIFAVVLPKEKLKQEVESYNHNTRQLEITRHTYELSRRQYELMTTSYGTGQVTFLNISNVQMHAGRGKSIYGYADESMGGIFLAQGLGPRQLRGSAGIVRKK